MRFYQKIKNKKGLVLLSCHLLLSACTTVPMAIDEHSRRPFTVIYEYDHRAVTQKAASDVRRMVAGLQPLPNANAKLIEFSKRVKNVPYSTVGAQGESDWCPEYPDKRGCLHVQQDPIYRTDSYDCATLVNVGLAAIYSKNLSNFETQILKVSYGAAGLPATHIRYFNRNNFVSADFNPVNQQRGFLRDATREGVFAALAKTKTTTIDHQKWFRHQKRNKVIGKNIRVLRFEDGMVMRSRFINEYPPNNLRLLKRKVSIDYIPKTSLMDCTYNHCRVRLDRMTALPTPSIVEVIRDDRKWRVGGRNIRQVIGTGINVSHLGFLYRQIFHQGQKIYDHTSCYQQSGQKVCEVAPVFCEQHHCSVVMFLHATNAYPNGYYWSETKNSASCTANPTGNTVGPCNRVVAMPLSAYLLQESQGRYPFIQDPSILGLHIEKIRL